MKKKKASELGQAGRFASRGLERVLHEKARLGIMTSLVMRPEDCCSRISSACAR
jgi:hypothetical protein